LKHYAILIHNQSKTQTLIKGICDGLYKEFNSLKDKKVRILSNIELARFMDEEERHGIKTLTSNTAQFSIEKSELRYYSNKASFWENNKNPHFSFDCAVPKPLQAIQLTRTMLVKFEDVSVDFVGKPILAHINWTINKGDFWQLIGPNGSGKSTLLNMITGDSHKGYGQNLTLFGNRKGSGESVWDIKKRIGYFTPSMTDKFKGNHNLENMLISGLYDSVGLYELSSGEKRLLMVARAMIKHPPLLILDEPTAGLDDSNANLFMALVNKIASETESAIIYVSHRTETDLKPQFIYQLIANENGSVGKIV